MSLPEEKHYRDKAEEFERLANETANAILSQTCSTLADEYRALARYYELLKQRRHR
jgi:hypothetical protein